MSLKNLKKESGMGTGLLNLGKDLFSAAKGGVPLTMKPAVKGASITPGLMDKAKHLMGRHAETNPLSSKAIRYGGVGLAAIGADRALAREKDRK